MNRLISLFLLIVVAPIASAHQLNQQHKYRYTVNVASSQALHKAVKEANQRGGDTKIIIAEGIYQLGNTINITADHIALMSASGDPALTVLQGAGMKPSKRVNNLIRVTGKHFVFSGLTGEAAPNHIIQIVGEANADNALIEHCILQDAYEQIIKVSHRASSNIAADKGIIRDCTFGYTQGIGPQYYIGGIDMHLGRDWVIESNQFIGIASPGNRVAEHAIHLWNNTQDNKVLDNIIINSDRGIGFGMAARGNKGGLIADNIIYHADNDHPNADAGIILETSPGTQVENNWLIQHHDYPNAIEYRFKATREVNITNNGTNKRIRERNHGQADVNNNHAINDLPPTLKQAILERFPAHYQQMVFDTLYPPE